MTCSAGLSPPGCTGSPACATASSTARRHRCAGPNWWKDADTGKSLNGRLCPNALLSDDVRYDDVTRGGFVFVTGVPLSPQQRAVLAGRGTEVLEVESGSSLDKWLEDGNAAAALVRPDFTVLRAGRDVAALCEAAPRFLVA